MWSVTVKILSILGVIVLCLLAFALTALLLVLFCPAVYRGEGRARSGEYRARFRFRWLFGLVRGSCAYPEDGRLRIKALWITVYDSGGKAGKGGPRAEDAGKQESPDDRETAEQKNAAEQDPAQQSQAERGQAGQQDQAGQSHAGQSPAQQGPAGTDPGRNAGDRDGGGEPGPERKAGKLARVREKLRSYLEIVRDKENQGLAKHALGRLGRILRSIRPRYMRAQAVVGLGEPDLTGYAYGAYWAVKPFLGKRCRVDITPDFERRVLEGEVFLKGHVTAAALLYHLCRVLLDRRLRQLQDRFKSI